MKFLPVEICKKLIEMGCKSKGEDQFTLRINGTPVFGLEDFVGTHEQAKENCAIIWGDGFVGDCAYDWCVGCNEGCCNESHAWHLRHAVIDSEDWVEYLTRTLKENE